MPEKLNPSSFGLLDESGPGLLDESADAEGTKTSPAPDAPVETAKSDVGTGATTEKTADEGKAEAAEPASAEPFLFGGREWKNQAEAEHSWKSWEGRIQAEQSRSKELESNLHSYWEYVQSVAKENEELRAKLNTPPPAEEAGKEKADVSKDGIDFDQIGRLMNMARAQGLDPMDVGIRAYAAQAEKAFEAKISEKLATIEQHVEQTKEADLVRNADREMFLWAQELKYDSGQPAYPELQKDALNSDFVTQIFRTWKRLGNEYGAKYAYSLAGFDYAYRLTRDDMGTAAPQQPPVARDERGRFTVANNDAKASSEIVGTQPNPTKKGPAKTETQAMLEELAEIKPVKIGGTDLGFYP